MPGPYAHITMLHELMRPDRLESIFPQSSRWPAALAACFPYCSLGAVSPDYPNLAGASGWADAMHCSRACGMIAGGIRAVRAAKESVQDKLFAWLLGYCAHVAADVTIHPVVRAKVGEYAENRRQHRICEMNQDSYIYRRMNLGEIGESDTFAVTIALCSTSADICEPDRDICALWSGMLGDAYPELFGADPPDIGAWHREFIARAARCRGGEMRLFPLAGVIAEQMDLSYPAFRAIDRQYVEYQVVPSERPNCLHYDDIFDCAAGNVMKVWRLVAQAVCSGVPVLLPGSGEWNLDTGRDEDGRLVFWD